MLKSRVAIEIINQAISKGASLYLPIDGMFEEMRSRRVIYLSYARQNSVTVYFSSSEPQSLQSPYQMESLYAQAKVYLLQIADCRASEQVN